MSNEEFAVYIRGPWRFARDLGVNRVEFRGMAKVSAVRCGISVRKFTKIIEKITSKFDCLTWEDENHNILRVHGVSRVHAQMRRFQNRNQTGTDIGTKSKRLGSNSGGHEVEVELEAEGKERNRPSDTHSEEAKKLGLIEHSCTSCGNAFYTRRSEDKTTICLRCREIANAKH